MQFTEDSGPSESRLFGDVSIAVPLSWNVVGYLLFAGIVVCLAFFGWASYSRIEVVAGTIVPDKGISTILPSRNGVIVSLNAVDGQFIRVGSELATIRVEEDAAGSVSSQAAVAAAVAVQDDQLSMQMDSLGTASDAQRRQLEAQRAGLASEIGELQNQIALQRDLISSANRDLDRARTIADRGFISQRDLQSREETLIARQQGLSQQMQSLASKKSALAEAQRSVAEMSAQTRAQLASLAATRAQVAQQAANTAGLRSYVIRAPISGRVATLAARVGQVANVQNALMTLIPSGSVLRAELLVPSSAIGFVKAGQDVNLAIDAFPYQRFGTVKGRIVEVASNAVSRPIDGGAPITVYPVTVALDRDTIAAYGKSMTLLSGMTLTARIVTEKQSLLQWLFEPLFAVGRR